MSHNYPQELPQGNPNNIQPNPFPPQPQFIPQHYPQAPLYYPLQYQLFNPVHNLQMYNPLQTQFQQYNTYVPYHPPQAPQYPPQLIPQVPPQSPQYPAQVPQIHHQYPPQQSPQNPQPQTNSNKTHAAKGKTDKAAKYNPIKGLVNFFIWKGNSAPQFKQNTVSDENIVRKSLKQFEPIAIIPVIKKSKRYRHFSFALVANFLIALISSNSRMINAMFANK